MTIDNRDILIRLREHYDTFKSEEAIMKHWDSWRKYIADGGGGSWPRECFESMIDSLGKDLQDAINEIENLKAERDSLFDELEHRWNNDNPEY